VTDNSAPFERLLDLQEHDTRIDQLTHRRSSLPERAELVATEASIGELERLASGVQSKRDAASRDQKRREDEVAAVEAKIAEINTAMYAGKVTSPRELQTMQEEIESLKRRLGSIEDEIIELMEYADPLDEQLGIAAEQRSVLDQQVQTLLARIAEQEVLIDDELKTVHSERDAIAVEAPAEVMDMYEDMRRSFAGLGIVRLEHGTCGGCHLQLPAAERDRLKHLAADVPVYCEECGRLLVR
jgi:predicted  nucleic acid-binding Zn-ribbon protein